MSYARLVKEYRDFKMCGIPGCHMIRVNDDVHHIYALLVGPKNTPYEGGIFHLDIRFPNEYPFRPPRVKFLTKIYHPNITNSGFIDLDILKGNWPPSYTTKKLLISILSFLSDPNPSRHCTSSNRTRQIAKLYKKDREAYDSNARAYTWMHATETNITPLQMIFLLR